MCIVYLNGSWLVDWIVALHYSTPALYVFRQRKGERVCVCVHVFEKEIDRLIGRPIEGERERERERERGWKRA